MEKIKRVIFWFFLAAVTMLLLAAGLFVLRVSDLDSGFVLGAYCLSWSFFLVRIYES